MEIGPHLADVLEVCAFLLALSFMWYLLAREGR